MFPKIGIPPNHPILISFSIIHHPFWGTTIFSKHPSIHFHLQLLSLRDFLASQISPRLNPRSMIARSCFKSPPKRKLSNGKKTWLLPLVIGFFKISYYRNPYQTASILESNQFFFFSWLNCLLFQASFCSFSLKPTGWKLHSTVTFTKNGGTESYKAVLRVFFFHYINLH